MTARPLPKYLILGGRQAMPPSHCMCRMPLHAVDAA
jgi:hypothetical protein